MGPRSAIAALLATVAAAAACASRPGTEPVDGVLDLRMERTVDFDAMVEDLAAVPMVYVGESHTNPEHHAIQLRILDELSRRNPHLILGMEMLQRPYQAVLDRWSAGEMDEATFLREADWYGQWSDWALYGPILRLAKERGIRVVGLNANRFYVGETMRHGLDGIPAWMRARLPAVIDTSVKEHRKAVREVFVVHPGMENTEERFRRFYEAQCVWDETMAESAVEALAASPHRDAAIVVFAGSMHVKSFRAIPERARRRNGRDYRVVLPLEREEFPEDGLTTGPGRPADYVIFTGPSPPPSLVRLGVILRGGDSVLTTVVETGPAAAAGLRAGDVLLTVDGVPIRDVVDLRLALERLSPGQKVRFTWTREGAPMEGGATIPAVESLSMPRAGPLPPATPQAPPK